MGHSANVQVRGLTFNQTTTADHPTTSSIVPSVHFGRASRKRRVFMFDPLPRHLPYQFGEAGPILGRFVGIFSFIEGAERGKMGLYGRGGLAFSLRRKEVI